ncbi:hypothetical protein BTO20_11870 [Mycobacterium dioxanotrophicus]|uniref:Uncharacterized protein n=1 Tax=Mycobacterium dioxanotrophicus TaxID=482462 RepID=A0A1Y0C270_9MYCO|nr:hypothetical protein BTO20_11870 [Mycobacterium dioxanotrophicus]
MTRWPSASPQLLIGSFSLENDILLNVTNTTIVSHFSELHVTEQHLRSVIARVSGYAVVKANLRAVQ